MKDLFRPILLIFVLCFSVSVLAQNEYEIDSEFKTFNSKKVKKSFEGKKKFNVHFGLGYNLSTIMGKDVAIFKDTLTAVKNRTGLDSYKIEPTFFPTAAIDMSFNFSRKISLTAGFKYNKLGWKEVAKYEDNDHFYKYYARYDFHYLSAAIGLQGHINKHVSIYGGHTFSLLVKNDIFQREIESYRGDTLRNWKQMDSFNQLTGVKSLVLVPQFFIGTHFGFDRLRFNVNATFTPTFIQSNIKYNNIAVEAGLIFKLFRDYDNKF